MRCTYYSGIFQVTEMLVVEHVHFLLLYTAIFLRCIIFLQISRISLGPQKLRPQNFSVFVASYPRLSIAWLHTLLH